MAARRAWDRALELGTAYGYRNAQVTVIAPTGTIGLVMDCDTTGIEPDIALVKYKQLAGGGMLKIVNNTVPLALKKLGYAHDEIQRIVEEADQRAKTVLAEAAAAGTAGATAPRIQFPSAPAIVWLTSVATRMPAPRKPPSTATISTGTRDGRARAAGW